MCFPTLGPCSGPREGEGSSNVSTLLQMHLWCECLFSRVDSEVSESVCIKSNVTQHKDGVPGFEPGPVGASPEEAFPSEHLPPAKSTQCTGHLMIKQVG